MRFLDHDAVNAEIGPRSRVQIWRDVKADRAVRLHEHVNDTP